MRGIEAFVEDLILHVVDFEENGRMFVFVRIAAKQYLHEGQGRSSQDIDARSGKRSSKLWETGALSCASAPAATACLQRAARTAILS